MFITFLKKRQYQTLFLLLIFTFFLFIRAPDILIQGRFWAEEGNIFYINALTMPPLRALFVVYGGYINIGASGAALIARYLYIPLEYAPYITTFIGLIFQLTPLYILLTAKDQWLAPIKVRILATLLILFVPESSEISLQSLHIQFHLTLACIFITCLKTDQKKQRWLKLFLLFFAPLCGLMPIFLIPILVAKLIMDRNRLRLEQCIALILGSLIQLVFFCLNLKYHIDMNNVTIIRNTHLSLNDLCSVIYIRDIIFLFLGHHSNISIRIMAEIFHNVQAHQPSITPCIVSTFFLGIILFIFLKYPKTRHISLLFLTNILVLSVSVYGVIGGTTHIINPYFTERYTYISQVLFVLILLYFSLTLPTIGKIISNILIIWLLIIGSYNFFLLFPGADHGFGKIWQKEIQKWREDSNYQPKIWSQGWYLVLPKTLPYPIDTHHHQR